MSWPDEHFPGTPAWVRAAIADAVTTAGVNPSKWTVPLEAIARYESNFSPAANVCADPELNEPLGMFQLARGMYRAARDAGLIASMRLGDPIVSAEVAIYYIDSRLEGYGGYHGIGTLTSEAGLLARTDRGPRDVLRAWVNDPDAFNLEAARELYRGY